ncbi:hypothetical protein EV121DRAFT_261318, partial [Schizophyllum commune]
MARSPSQDRSRRGRSRSSSRHGRRSRQSRSRSNSRQYRNRSPASHRHHRRRTSHGQSHSEHPQRPDPEQHGTGSTGGRGQKRQASREPSTGSVINKDSASSRPKKSKKGKKSRKTRNRINDDDLDRAAFNAALEQFTHIGKIFGRYCNANDPILDIFEVGINRDPHAPRSQFTTDNNMLYDAYSLLSSLYPKTVDYFLEIAHRDDCQAILRAYADAAGASRTQARSDDVKGVKSAIVFWTQDDFSKPHPGPLNKAVAGYHHPDCARLIAPTVVDPVDEVARNKLLKLEIPRKPSDLCRLLYEGEDFKNNDAFLKHPYLVKCYKHVFCGPSAAVANDGDSAKQRASNGDIHGVREVSIPAIAYCACLVHFALSSQANFAFGGNRGWQYGVFYR